MFEIFPDASASTFELLVKVFLNLGLVILFIYAALSVARRLKLGTFGQINKQLTLIETLYLSPKQKIHLVRIGKKAMLIGATDDRLTVLQGEVEVDVPDSLATPAHPSAEDIPPVQFGSPKTFWEHWLTSLNPRLNIMRHHTGE